MKPKPKALISKGRHRHQPETQPDFGANWYTESQAPIRYESRPLGGNQRHDIVYLSSYIHDAEFRLDEIRLRRKSLVIPLNRARWEVWLGGRELPYIRSELTISSVVSFRLELTDTYIFPKFFKAPKLIISHLQVLNKPRWRHPDEEYLIFNFVFGCKLCLQVGERYTVRLVDLPQ